MVDYAWTDNPTESGVSDCNADVLNECLMNLKYNSSGGGIPTSNCKFLTKKVSGTSVSLKWKDPDDTVIDGFTLSSWAGTQIVRKMGSYPTSATDGVVIADNKTRNAYLKTAFADTLPDSNTYYYRAFPYSTNGVYNLDNDNYFYSAIIYGFRIDTTDSNPATRVSYITGCHNELFSAGYMNYTTGLFNYGDWANAFFMPRPVMLKYDGTVAYELNPNDYTLKADGTASDIANTAFGGNAMMGFPQVWIKYETVGIYQNVYISNQQVDSDYRCFTHYNKSNVLRDEIYVAIYQPANISSVLRSISGQTILVGAAGTTEIAYAQANGLSWNTGTCADWMMINMLLTLISKSTDTQTKFGAGYNSSANATTGELNKKGLFFGTSANGAVKVFGIENYYGNYWKRIAGLVYTATGIKLKMTEGTQDGSTVTGYNTDGTGYITPGITASGTSGGYISASTLTAYGLYPAVASGSSSTYFCDGLWWAAGGYALVGGSYDSGLLDGAFTLSLGNAVSTSDATLGASLSCKPL